MRSHSQRHSLSLWWASLHPWGISGSNFSRAGVGVNPDSYRRLRSGRMSFMVYSGVTKPSYFPFALWGKRVGRGRRGIYSWRSFVQFLLRRMNLRRQFVVVPRNSAAESWNPVVAPPPPHAGVFIPLIRGERKLMRRLAGSVSLPITLAT